MGAKVFISYRRDDSAAYAGRVHDRLEREFGREVLFMDVDAMPLGVNFVKVLIEEVARCDVLLAIMGPGWLDARSAQGQRRLDDPNDIVRLEIATALKRDIPVIPILLDGTEVPKPDQLPVDLAELSMRHGLKVQHGSFHVDIEQLIRQLRSIDATPSEPALTATRSGGSQSRLNIGANITNGVTSGQFIPGEGRTEWFKDDDQAPEMVIIPSGGFYMGSSENEPQHELWERQVESPRHQVNISRPFAVARHPVTRGQFAAFVNNTGYDLKGGCHVWRGEQWEVDPDATWLNLPFTQNDSHPVVCVNWHDANAYAAWLSTITKNTYRLITEAEREYVTRAGSDTPFWWGTAITPSLANYDGTAEPYRGGGFKGECRNSTTAVGIYAPNPWGLFDVHGNVWEWCADVWHDTYNGAPTDGSSWRLGGDASKRVVRGGSWRNGPHILRSAYRGRSSVEDRSFNLGFRLVRVLE